MQQCSPVYPASSMSSAMAPPSIDSRAARRPASTVASKCLKSSSPTAATSGRNTMRAFSRRPAVEERLPITEARANVSTIDGILRVLPRGPFAITSIARTGPSSVVAITSAGTLLRTPPSTSNRLPTRTGGARPGLDDRTSAVDHNFCRSEISADRKTVQLEIIQMSVPEEALQHRLSPSCTDQRHGRHAEVAEGVPLHQLAPAQLDDFCRHWVSGIERSDERPNTRTTDSVEAKSFHAQFVQHSEMREPPRAAARQDDPHGSAEDPTTDPGDVPLFAAIADSVVRSGFYLVDPSPMCIGAGGSRHRDEVPLRLSRGRLDRPVGDAQHSIRLPRAKGVPRLVDASLSADQ
jgi:hypothetical protein